MSSKKDLVEAHAFNRRRLVTAFISGAPGGREVEPVRYGRTLVGGIVLAGLIVAGAAVSGFLKPTTPDNWRENKLVIGKTSGSRFVGYKGTLYPVINTTSARLILSSNGPLEVIFVPDDKIAAEQQGPTIGIPGAPDVLPEAARLEPSGWTACTNRSGGIRVSVADAATSRPATDQAFRVQAEGQSFLVSGRYRYPLPAGGNTSATLRILGLDAEAPQRVPGQWLDLVDVGSPLEPFDVPGQGDRVDTGVPRLDRVGTPLRVGDRPYLLVKGGRLLELTPFAYQVYRSSGPGARFPELELAATEVTRLRTVTGASQDVFPRDWPEDEVSPFTAPDAPCVRLTTGDDAAGYAELATATADGVEASGSAMTRTVGAGLGAVVRSSTGGVVGAGTTVLVDSTGTRYALGTRGGEQSAMAALGYGDVKPRAVPKAWLALFSDGPTLSTRAAGQLATGSS